MAMELVMKLVTKVLTLTVERGDLKSIKLYMNSWRRWTVKRRPAMAMKVQLQFAIPQTNKQINT